MNLYFAPLEGLTDSIYRRLHAQFFPGIDKYFSPFVSPTVHRCLTPREARELPSSPGYPLVPQIMSKSVDDFLWMAHTCQDRGYIEVNLNLGCPSGTVTSKGKGSGMLKNLSTLEAFLDQIYSKTPLPISIKSRVGFADTDIVPELVRIYNQYPVKELIIHPRIRTDFYINALRMNCWEYILENSSNPICFNGDICSCKEAQDRAEQYPGICSLMIGRGLIGDPGMFSPEGTNVQKLSAFYESLLEEYITAFGSARNAMFRLKENWRYLICRFEGSEKLGKQLRKTTDLAEYRSITNAIFHDLRLKPTLEPDWRPEY